MCIRDRFCALLGPRAASGNKINACDHCCGFIQGAHSSSVQGAAVRIRNRSGGGSSAAHHKALMPRGVLPRGALRKRGELVRDVIADALCGPNGYFATRLPVLAGHTALPFREHGQSRREVAIRAAQGVGDDVPD